MGHERDRGKKEKRKPKKKEPKAKGGPATLHKHEGDSTAKQINKHLRDIAKPDA